MIFFQANSSIDLGPSHSEIENNLRSTESVRPGTPPGGDLKIKNIERLSKPLMDFIGNQRS